MDNKYTVFPDVTNTNSNLLFYIYIIPILMLISSFTKIYSFKRLQIKQQEIAKNPKMSFPRNRWHCRVNNAGMFMVMDLTHCTICLTFATTAISNHQDIHELIYFQFVKCLKWPKSQSLMFQIPMVKSKRLLYSNGQK